VEAGHQQVVDAGVVVAEGEAGEGLILLDVAVEAVLADVEVAVVEDELELAVVEVVAPGGEAPAFVACLGLDVATALAGEVLRWGGDAVVGDPDIDLPGEVGA